MEVQVHAFLTLELGGNEWSAFPRGQVTNTHWIGGWVGFIAGLDTMEKCYTIWGLSSGYSVVQPLINHYINLAIQATGSFIILLIV